MEQSGHIVMKIQGKNVVLYRVQLRELTSKVFTEAVITTELELK